MTIWTCAACAIEHADTEVPPTVCVVCSDDRQFVPASGQRWTTQAELAAAGHHGVIGELEEDLFAVDVVPELGIGQRGLFLRTSGGNLLWEPPGFIDDDMISTLRDLGGVDVISASHPHLTGASIQWSQAFRGAPVLVASADREWIRRPDPAIELWHGVRQVLPGVTFVQCGGHFAGSSVAHWREGAGGRGALLTGDTIAVGADRASVSVMRSFVNKIPLPERAVRRIQTAIGPFPFDRVYGAFGIIDAGAAAVVDASLNRYVSWLRGDVPDEPEK
ncbi:hydrolase [Aeromicrobium chenweiae]|uniref:Hydrolase n=1 Tax=Aeromicrobium chenweiae TaxID=2079793 RepID=A0A2S0WMB3_9ACTN|nr:hydrolase [Aeromicrobium chenweiae]AWB92410.1 hydrolase [Aeromicrobium chenweiae]TGN31303.1 hydrolase [Aeromicrobium chenweiae]